MSQKKGGTADVTIQVLHSERIRATRDKSTGLECGAAKSKGGVILAQAFLACGNVGLRSVHEWRDGQARRSLGVALTEELVHHSARPLPRELPGLGRVADVGSMETHCEQQPCVLPVGSIESPRGDARLELCEMIEVKFHVCEYACALDCHH